MTDEQFAEVLTKFDLMITSTLENQPRITSDRFNPGATSPLGGGATLTVTFPVNIARYEVRLVRAYADVRALCTYNWTINGFGYAKNEVQLIGGIWLHSDIILVVVNTGIPAVEISFEIQGWGDSKVVR